MKNKTFEEWMKEVDHQISIATYMTSADLPDCCYRDWYDDGVTPKAAAKKAIRNAAE